MQYQSPKNMCFWAAEFLKVVSAKSITYGLDDDTVFGQGSEGSPKGLTEI
jgi:hypothetical protein